MDTDWQPILNANPDKHIAGVIIRIGKWEAKKILNWPVERESSRGCITFGYLPGIVHISPTPLNRQQSKKKQNPWTDQFVTWLSDVGFLSSKQVFYIERRDDPKKKELPQQDLIMEGLVDLEVFNHREVCPYPVRS